MSQLWLRVALALYSLGLFHAVLTVVRRRQRVFRVALSAFALGAILHLVSLVEDGLALQHFPITSLQEAASLAAFLLAGAFLLVYWRYRFQSISVFVFPLVFVLTLTAALERNTYYTDIPLLRTTWLYLHVSLIVLGNTAFFLTFIAGVMYLIQERALKSKKPWAFYYRLPPLETIDDLAYKSLAIGFPFITLGIVSGAVWASAVWGPEWPLDPKIALSFVTWLIYLSLLFARWSAGWRGRKAAYFAILGFIAIVVTWGTNTGVHSFITP
ncbi:MAG: cytochrome c biogenesis protein CcsA [Acidobacteria bacterium]|nr:cytochrome c biogenesis protein CcsA [Acidobacteriota bacterium]